MKSKKIIIVMTATLLCIVFLGAFLAQGYEVEGFELRCAIERNVAPSYSQRDLNVNKETIAKLSSEASIEDLENAYYYQMIENKYVDGQVEFITPSKTGSCDEPCTQINNCQSCNC